MALDATQVRIGVTGNLYSAVVGTAMPADIVTALPAAWKEHGYLSEEGVAVALDTEVQDIPAWQSYYPVRQAVTARTWTKKFTLLQRNTENLKLAFGGGSVAVVGALATYTPPTSYTVYERAWCLEVTDGVIIDRYAVSRGMPRLSGDVQINNTDAVKYEMEVTALAPSGADSPWKLLSTDVTNMVAG